MEATVGFDKGRVQERARLAGSFHGRYPQVAPRDGAAAGDIQDVAIIMRPVVRELSVTERVHVERRRIADPGRIGEEEEDPSASHATEEQARAVR
jgi:hypothetical protein